MDKLCESFSYSELLAKRAWLNGQKELLAVEIEQLNDLISRTARLKEMQFDGLKTARKHEATMTFPFTAIRVLDLDEHREIVIGGEQELERFINDSADDIKNWGKLIKEWEKQVDEKQGKLLENEYELTGISEGIHKKILTDKSILPELYKNFLQDSMTFLVTTAVNNLFTQISFLSEEIGDLSGIVMEKQKRE